MPDSTEPSLDALPEGERLYAQAVLARGADEALDIEALCAAHPAHASTLRALHAQWQALRDEAGPARREPAFAHPSSNFSSAVLSRLAVRRAASSRYRFEGELARGGMGAILRVWDQDLRRHLAMKVVLEKSRGEGEASPVLPATTLARFLEEAQVTGQLDHPGIVPVHELGLDSEGRVYFTMKLVKGVTLKTVFEELSEGRGGWTRERVLGLLLRVCEAMAYAHDKGVIHRDLKPANVMVGRFGEVYVMDWGLAKILGREDSRDLRIRPEAAPNSTEVRSDRHDQANETPESPLLTMDGDVVGTPAYMSPEQAEGRVAQMGPPSDVYALGAMLYQLLAGHMPYVAPGVRCNNRAIWRAVQEGPPKPLHACAPQAPAELVAIAEKAMARDAEARFADTSELAADLAAFIEGRVVRAYESGAWAEARKWVQRNRGLAASIAVAVALAVGGLASTTYVEARGRSKEQELRERAEAETAKVLRLSDGKLLQELVRESDALWPAAPEKLAALESWMQRANALLTKLPEHRATLTSMRAESPEQVWHRDVLAELVAGLERFESGLVAPDATTAEHGASVAKRLSQARELESGFAAGGAHASAWQRALPELSESYPGLSSTPQMGLLPLGPDPHSKLWEFAHLPTGVAAERDASGKLVLTEDTGLVLVLLPGGSFAMGAQAQDPAGRNYDPLATPNEAPVHDVDLGPYFLSKYEMTQGQWLRLTGTNPSNYQRDRFAPTLLHPVEQVSWEDCVRWLPRADLHLPSEAQWEFAARGATNTPWWTGATRESLAARNAANLADQAAARAGATWAAIADWPDFDDGAALHAAVGTYAANPFGLHETAGNLWEWCADGYDESFYAQGPRRDPVRDWQGTTNRISRGGGLNLSAMRARSSCRSNDSPTFQSFTLGVRPARAWEP